MSPQKNRPFPPGRLFSWESDTPFPQTQHVNITPFLCRSGNVAAHTDEGRREAAYSFGA